MRHSVGHGLVDIDVNIRVLPPAHVDNPILQHVPKGLVAMLKLKTGEAKNDLSHS